MIVEEFGYQGPNDDHIRHRSTAYRLNHQYSSINNTKRNNDPHSHSAQRELVSQAWTYRYEKLS